MYKMYKVGLTFKGRTANAVPSSSWIDAGSKVMLNSNCSPGGKALTFSGILELNPDPCSAALPAVKEMGVWPVLLMERGCVLMELHSK